jgi:5'-nucleotidase
MAGRWRVHRGLVGALALAALGTVAVAPLAVSSGPASATKIDGARSINDRVEVQVRETKDRTTDVHLLAYNDFHGNLEPGALNIYGQFAGGAAFLSKLVQDREAQYGDKAVTLMAGDNIGASPLANSLFHEEPATIVTSLMGTDFASVGNHEFDKGAAELLRVADGGCHTDGCTGAPYALPGGGSTDIYPGATFQYLSANVVDSTTGDTLFPAYGIATFSNDRGTKQLKVGIIGEVLEETPTIVTPAGVAGLTFLDEADAANAAVKRLKEEGVKTFVLVIHQGGAQTSGATLNGCVGNLAGSAIEAIAQRLDPAISVIVSGHTHAEYRCTITQGGTTRLVTSASSFGRVLSDITLTIDNTGRVVAMAAENVIVRNALNPSGPGVIRVPDPSKEDPEVAAVVQQYVTASAPLANQVVGAITADINRAATPLGETPLGNLIADAQLAATAPSGFGDAVIAFMNPGGVRADLTYAQVSGGEAPGEVTYGEVFTVQPFGNSLVTKTMTGTQIRSLLEQQFPGCGGQTTKRILQVSAGFTYDQTPEAGTCADRIGAITLNGTPVDPATSYRVTMNSFLATGGDGFTVFNQGVAPLGGAVDLDALVEYFEASTGPIAPPATTRIT